MSDPLWCSVTVNSTSVVSRRPVPIAAIGIQPMANSVLPSPLRGNAYRMRSGADAICT
jgi:hypothetical protein